MIDSYGSQVSFYIDQIMKCVNHLKEIHGKYYEDCLLFAYRGESKDYGKTKLQPSIFRNPEYIKKECHLFELLSDYNFVQKDATSIEKAIESQHYIAISRMLDITFSALNALYFACEGNLKEDANLFVFGFPKYYSPHSNYVQNFYDKMLSNEDCSYSRNFKVFSHSFSNDRIKAQKGGFIFFPGKNFVPINECYYETITIKREDKPTILDELKLLFQIDLANIYPEKDNIAELIKFKFAENTYENSVTTLTLDDELKFYFERLNYELRLMKKDEMTIQRILRKEKNDLLSFVRSVHQNQEKSFENRSLEEIENEIVNKFLTFSLMFKEV